MQLENNWYLYKTKHYNGQFLWKKQINLDL
jgi:hypothetical protein